MHQDTGAANRAPSDDYLLVHPHRVSHPSRACGVLYSRGYEAIGIRHCSIKDNPRNSRIGKNGEIRARWKWVYIRRARITSRPVGRVDAGCGNECAPTGSTICVWRRRNAYPV